ncbi:hypothetical protein [Demequina sp. NBRC 110057]|uniref:hypothetical protein n=1 Tax=Demequina sp. NBRC 110057 TaxID=1570346 RepID=UPI000A00FEF0|nr:hypothetical protein [Demequina sp. NBRC 110057]
MPSSAAARALGAAVLAVALAGCAADEGPLTMADDDVTVCAPHADGATMYFGMPVTNAGADAATVTDLSWSQENVDSVEFLIDLEAADLDQFIGTMRWPTDEPLGYEEDLLDRAVRAQGAVIPAGSTVDLIVAVSPSSHMWNAEVTDIALAYDADASYVADSGMTMVVATEMGCDASMAPESPA